MKSRQTSSFLYTQRQGFSLMTGAFFALGIGVYFALPFEPWAWLIGLITFMTLVLWVLTRRDNMARLVFGYASLFCLGMCIASARTYMVSAPVLSQKMYDVQVSGEVSKVEARRDGYRITLKDV